MTITTPSLVQLFAVLQKDNTSNCRVKRHLISTTIHKHGRPAEAKPDITILTQGVKMGGILLDSKLYSKVLRVYSCEISN